MLLDDKGVPQIFNHVADPGKEGKPMKDDEVFTLVVDSLVSVYQKEGLAIKNVNHRQGTEYPNIVMQDSSANTYYVLVRVSVFPMNLEAPDSTQYVDFISTADSKGAFPTIADVGVFCFDSLGAPAICGGSFALKYDKLQLLSPPEG